MVMKTINIEYAIYFIYVLDKIYDLIIYLISNYNLHQTSYVCICLLGFSTSFRLVWRNLFSAFMQIVHQIEDTIESANLRQHFSPLSLLWYCLEKTRQLQKKWSRKPVNKIWTKPRWQFFSFLFFLLQWSIQNQTKNSLFF